MSTTILIELVKGPHDGAVVRIDSSKAQKMAHAGRLEFAMSRRTGPLLAQDAGQGQAIYSVPVPIPRDAVCEFVGYK